MKKALFVGLIGIALMCAAWYSNYNLFKIWDNHSYTVEILNNISPKEIKIEYGFFRSQLTENDEQLIQLQEKKVVFQGIKKRNLPFYDNNRFFLITCKNYYYLLSSRQLFYQRRNSGRFFNQTICFKFFLNNNIPYLDISSNGNYRITASMTDIKYANLQRNNFPVNGNAFKLMHRLPWGSADIK
jgi:hypothetical protein